MVRSTLRAFVALMLPLALTGCFLSPGKFNSTLTVNADRSFTFSYQGEVIALDFAKEMAAATKAGGKSGLSSTPEDMVAKKTETDRKNREIAAALSKEAGYRKVDYVGDGKFVIDYAISGRLTHNFIYPFNLDAEAIIPFIAIELRAGDTVRIKAPAFAKDSGFGNATGMGEISPAGKMDGTFTLDTDAEVISQNNEGGVATVGGRKRITWTVNALTMAAPMAVLGLR